MARNLAEVLPGPFAARPDGRRERSRSSRGKIIDAYMLLVEGGEYAPTATRVAEAAGVGLRSVFRHFDDMEKLYREACDQLVARVMPIVFEELAGNNWKARILSLAERRARIFTLVMPYRIFGSLKLHDSPQIFAYHKGLYEIESTMIEAEVPASVKADPLVLASLKAMLSFDTWRYMRQELDLSVEDVTAVVKQTLTATMRDLPED